ncbi:hypothetical protein [Acinetobacter nosocomialis]|uniref:hypothetical protein n=1 Tax=Acinetobacter nosocomialis TaxID=106654 RepID=UPI002AB5CA65|nr:hypothetical protein [Acinetobacter nosocomialis]
MVRQELVPFNPILKIEAWVFRYYMYQWHRAVETKRGRSFEPMEYVSDEAILGASHE